jgi:hypothetical protein
MGGTSLWSWLSRSLSIWLLVAPLSGCLLVVSTNPTTVSGATIVFVAVDDHGAFVASLRVVVSDIEGRWRDDGWTAQDGSFRCGVMAGVERVRADVTPPRGYVIAGAGSWPRELEVNSGQTLQVEIGVKAIES